MKTIDEKSKEEEKRDKVNKKIMGIGKITLKSIRNGLITFGGVYLVNKGFIPNDNIEHVKNSIYAGETFGGVITLISAYYLTIKNFFQKSMIIQ